MQAYIKSKLELNCIIIYYLSIKLKKRYLKSTILNSVKPLYSLAKAGNHQFIIYLDYHKEKLGMKILFYNIYLLITKDGDINFGIIGLQTDIILNIGTKVFMNKKEAEIIEAKFKTKS